jgi:hypothetical protein
VPQDDRSGFFGTRTRATEDLHTFLARAAKDPHARQYANPDRVYELTQHCEASGMRPDRCIVRNMATGEFFIAEDCEQQRSAWSVMQSLFRS